MKDFTVSEDQLTAIYAILIGRSWSNSQNFEAYQKAWEVVENILGVTSPHDGNRRVPMTAKKPATFCVRCEGHNPNCEQCHGLGYFYPDL